MDYEAHVGLVDAHAEGYGGYNHVDAFHEEVVLCSGTGVGVKSRMICRRLDVVCPQYGSEFLHFLP